MKIICAHCGRIVERAAGHVNRSSAQGLRLFCGRQCAGLAKRKHKTKAQRKLEKKLYDQEYRVRNQEALRVKKRAYHLRSYDPKKQRTYNQRRMPHHVEYCRRPEYKAYKRDYDRQYRAREYGPFAEAYSLTLDLNREIKERMTNHEIKWENKTSNKTQFRKRDAKEEKRTRPRLRDRRPSHSAAVG